jgi:Reverse transcriptase (RNA-dependent DNA polymerase).
VPFGLKNAPATFQRVMDTILRGLINNICLVYLDDIIILSTSLQEHMTSLKEIFNRLRDAGLKIQLDKLEFIKREVAYLGHVVTPEGVKPNPEKIKAIKAYPMP